jgi:predicted Zn finger-like uncharacterized protein
MIIQCSSCKTTYRVADELLKDTTLAFRCSRCKHTFELAPSSTEDKLSGKTPSGETLSAKTEEEKELSFTFAASKQEGAEDRARVDDVGETVNRPLSSLSDERLKSSDHDATFTNDEPFSSSGRLGSLAEDDLGSPAARAQPQDPQTLPRAREATDNIFSLDPYRDQSVSTTPYLTLFALLVIFFGFVTGFYVAHPDTSEGFVKTIPLVGGSVLKNNHLKKGVALQSLRASYQGIQGNREVFVVTGIAQNQNPVIIREVRVSGQIYNLEGKEIEQQTTWIGNAISPRIIRGMTVQDISDLQRLKPLKSFEIPPGDSISFTIVFLKPTKGIKDFSCEVLTAEDAA